MIEKTCNFALFSFMKINNVLRNMSKSLVTAITSKEILSAEIYIGVEYTFGENSRH